MPQYAKWLHFAGDKPAKLLFLLQDAAAMGRVSRWLRPAAEGRACFQPEKAQREDAATRLRNADTERREQLSSQAESLIARFESPLLKEQQKSIMMRRKGKRGKRAKNRTRIPGPGMDDKPSNRVFLYR